MFHFIYHFSVFIGFVTTLLLIGYLVLLVISISRKDELNKADTNFKLDSMPVMRPLPIPTANQDSTIDKIITWIFSVRKWQVMEAFEYEDKQNNITYVIPAGFVFDGASIPRALWAILSPIGLLLVPGLLHDFGYKYDGIFVKTQQNEEPQWSTDIKGKEAWDKLFERVGNEVNGIEVLNAIATFGLYVGGFAAWNNWREQKEPPPKMAYSLRNESSDSQQNNEVMASESNVAEPTSVLETPPKKTAKKPQSNRKKQLKTVDYELVSGTTKTTKIGAINENQQQVLGKIVTKDDTFKNVYKLHCNNCKNVYGVKSTMVNKAKCPNCQDGKPGVDII